MRLEKVDGTANEYRLDGIGWGSDAITWAIGHLGGCAIKDIYGKDEGGDPARIGCSFISRNEMTQESLERAIACNYEIHLIKGRLDSIEGQVYPMDEVPTYFGGFSMRIKTDSSPTLAARVMNPKPWWRFGR